MRAGRTPPPESLGIRHFLTGGIVLFLFTVLAAGQAEIISSESENPLLAGLRKIHAEVKEMGPYPGDEFIRREFFVGEDDDDTNKDIQAVVLIQPFESTEKMTIRVTEMAREPAGSRTSVAKSSKALVCLVGGDRVEIQSSDYDKPALERLVPDILTAVRNKKRLLKMGTAFP